MFVPSIFWIFVLKISPFLLLSCKFVGVIATLEDDYVRRFTNQESVIWDLARKLYQEDKIALENICVNAHRKSGKGRINTEHLVGLALKQRQLQFTRNWMFNPVKIDVLSYWYKEKEFYITRGLCPDCVFYLRFSRTYPGRFRLERHVRGVSHEAKIKAPVTDSKKIRPYRFTLHRYRVAQNLNREVIRRLSLEDVY